MQCLGVLPVLSKFPDAKGAVAPWFLKNAVEYRSVIEIRCHVRRLKLGMPLHARNKASVRPADGLDHPIGGANRFGMEVGGQLYAALNEMNANLARIVGQVRSGAEEIATSISEVASGNSDHSARTEHQASWRSMPQ